MIAAWNRFFHEPGDPRVPALIRICFAAIVLVNLTALYPYLEMWYGEKGVLPSDLTYLDSYQWSLLGLARSSLSLQLCYWIFVMQTLCLLVGFGSRFSAASVFVWLVSFQNRNQMILDGEDDVMRIVGFLLIFMPLAEVWSADAWWWQKKDAAQLPAKDSSPYSSRYSPWAVRLLQYFMVLVMFATGLYKLSGAPWRDGTALYYVARIDDLWGRFPVPHYFFDTPWTVRAMTWSVLYVELAIPFLIWFPQARRFSLLVLLAFHLSNEWAMHLFLFHWIMLCGWLSFLKREDFDAVARAWHRARGLLDWQKVATARA
jgi:hypothetical protein